MAIKIQPKDLVQAAKDDLALAGNMGVLYKLENLHTKKWIFSKDSEIAGIGGNDYADQHWKLIPGSGSYAGCYKLENYYTKNGWFPRMVELKDTAAVSMMISIGS